MEISKRYYREIGVHNSSLDRSMFVFLFFRAFEIFIFINISDKKCIEVYIILP